MNSYRFVIGLLPCLEDIFLGLTCIHLSCLGNKSLIHPLPPRYWCFLIRLRLWLRKICVYSQTVWRERAWPQSSVAVAVRQWLMWCLSRIWSRTAAWPCGTLYCPRQSSLLRTRPRWRRAKCRSSSNRIVPPRILLLPYILQLRHS